jgi:hypothetical protein
MASSSVTATTATKLLGSRLKVDAPPNSPSGRGLTVAEPVAAGTLLLRLDPLISVLDEPFLSKTCSTCFAVSKSVDDTVGKELRKCTGCGLLRYCSKVCNRQNINFLDVYSVLTSGHRYVRRKIGKLIIRENAII